METWLRNLSEPNVSWMEPSLRNRFHSFGTPRNLVQGFGRLPQTTPKLYWKNPKPFRLLGNKHVQTKNDVGKSVEPRVPTVFCKTKRKASKIFWKHRHKCDIERDIDCVLVSSTCFQTNTHPCPSEKAGKGTNIQRFIVSSIVSCQSCLSTYILWEGLTHPLHSPQATRAFHLLQGAYLWRWNSVAWIRGLWLTHLSHPGNGPSTPGPSPHQAAFN